MELTVQEERHTLIQSLHFECTMKRAKSPEDERVGLSQRKLTSWGVVRTGLPGESLGSNPKDADSLIK